MLYNTGNTLQKQPVDITEIEDEHVGVISYPSLFVRC